MFVERMKTHHSAMAEMSSYGLGARMIKDYLVQNRPTEDIKQKGTIYIHVPFCSKICSFCNMRRSLREPRRDYGQLVIAEILQYSQLPYIQEMQFDAVYFGGGTPTTLHVDDLRAILKAIKAHFRLTKEVEITIETTVTELTQEKLQMFREEGVNRFSVGVQTFNDQGRKLMGRKGMGEEAYKKLANIKEMGFQTLSMDLIYNYPGQTLEDLVVDLEHIKRLGLEGFSLYSLMNMKGTQIGEAQEMTKDKIFFDVIHKKMGAEGYDFLELTKMVTTDQYKYVMSRHAGCDTLPLGAGAGGNLGGLMLMNPINLDEYESSIKEFERRKAMLFNNKYKELAVFKGSLQKGILPDESYYQDLEAYKEVREKLEKHGYITATNKGYQLTKEGIFWGNNISRVLYEMVQK